MLEALANAVTWTSSLVWGPWTIALIFGTGLFLTLRFRFRSLGEGRLSAGPMHYLRDGMGLPGLAWIYALVVLGAVSKVKLVWSWGDLMNGLQVFPNIVGLLGLSGVVAAMLSGTPPTGSERLETEA